MFGRKQPQIKMTLEQCLSARVVRNPEARQQELPDGRIELSLPYVKPWLIRLFSRRNKTFLRKFQLDETGSQMWRRIDDKRRVQEMVDHLKKDRGLEDKQAVDSMVAYLHMLMVRGLVGLVVPQDDD